jgi:predicted DNA-binding WGR domain protein
MHNETQSDGAETTLRLRRVRPERNERRFYAMIVTADLFGDTVLLRNWGRIGTGGRIRWDLCADRLSAAARLHALAQRKRKRGYQDS